MSIECNHDTVAVPDPLPEAVAAVLRIRRDDANGVDERRIVDLVRRAALIASIYTPRTRYEWTSGAVCAVLRRHPDLASRTGLSSENLCRAAMGALEPTILPKRTDVGLAERVALLHGADIAWSADEVFRVWDGQRWARDDGGGLVTERVKHTARTLLDAEASKARRDAEWTKAEYADSKDKVKAAEKNAAAAATYAIKAESAATVRAAVHLLRSDPAIRVPIDVWDADPRLLATPDGTLELTDGGVKPREHRREDRITLVTRASYRPRADRSRWLTFIEQALPVAAVRDYFQRLMGHALLGGNTRRVLPLLVGPSSTGKTTALEAIAHALGDYAAPFELSLFVGDREGGRARPDLIAALPRRMIFTTETQDRWALDADRLKRITGGDSASARQVYSGQQQEGRPQFVPFIACNAAPQIRGADLALWRRLTAVPFDQVIPQPREDGELGARLREDADAVLSWLIEGLDLYLRDGGLGPVPDACTDAVRKIKTDLSLIDQWLDERCEDGDDHTEPVSALTDDVHAWCVWNRVPATEHPSAIALGKALAARGYGIDYAGGKRHRGRVRTGLRLAPDRDNVVPLDGDGNPTGNVRALRSGQQ